MNKTTLNSQKEKHSMLSLRRATGEDIDNCPKNMISIHALLAESDTHADNHAHDGAKFLSTLSLRRVTRVRCRVGSVRPSFLSTLSLRRATNSRQYLRRRKSNFYPRSPCGERHSRQYICLRWGKISIHALLAESDILSTCKTAFQRLFLSTLSLRRATGGL